jgi:hypothetical protein
VSDDYNVSNRYEEDPDEHWRFRAHEHLVERVKHHPPASQAAIDAHQAVREATVAFGRVLIETCPVGVELEAALFKLTDEVMAHANAAIARHGDRLPGVTAGT